MQIHIHIQIHMDTDRSRYNTVKYNAILHTARKLQRKNIDHIVTRYSDVTWPSWILKSPATQLFIQQSVYADIKESIKALHYRPFVRGFRQWLVGFPHKGPVMRKALPLSWRHHVTKDTQHLALTVELWGVYCILTKAYPCYNGIALYFTFACNSCLHVIHVCMSTVHNSSLIVYMVSVSYRHAPVTFKNIHLWCLYIKSNWC